MIKAKSHGEGLKAARLLMVLSSISPLFILWAIRGSSLIPDAYFALAVGVLLFGPNSFLYIRICTAKKRNDKRTIAIGTADDHRDHILVYLFAILLPFYSEDIGTWRELEATLAALAFIAFLFWHLNLHYMNLLFAVFGYRVFTIHSPADGNAKSGRAGVALITRRVTLAAGDQVAAYRISDTVYLEAEE
jgi:hypothetical protein